MYFDFYDLINKYAASFTAVFKTQNGFDDLGEELYTEEEKTLTGAVIEISDGKIYRSDGTLTDKDKYLFMFEELPLVDTRVIYKEKCYKVESQVENAEFTGVYQYTLKYVSAFSKG
ncbi:MAG: hypothetical protein LUD81_10550 [Clostridiales bacterium]|nr:hypothetical protein [Clostridiales bacterium]